ncbi:MAG: hypothetical protein ACFFBR_10950 [Promethearchaeota archaeon]
MSEEPVDADLDSPATRFAENVVAESVTILLVFLFGIASTILIVRGLPQTPVYEFYFYVLVFSWVNILVPLCVLGMDVALQKHLPELIADHHRALGRSIFSALAWPILLSFALVPLAGLAILLFSVQAGFPVQTHLVLAFAILTVPLTAVSLVFQGAFRGMQKMRYVAFAMGFYHGLYVGALAILFVTWTLNLATVIWTNIIVSIATIIYEVFILLKLIQRENGRYIQPQLGSWYRRLASTAIPALLLSLLGALFLYGPLLIVNVYRTSDVTFAAVGLALGIAVWIQQGLGAPYRVLIPRTSGEIARNAWSVISRYMRRAWKLGVLLSAFVVVVSLYYAGPVFSLLFGGTGNVALPYFILMAGSFLIYPFTVMFADVLIGIGKIKSVLIINGIWTGVVVVVLWFVAPIYRELIVAFIWLVGIPFLVVYLMLYQRKTDSRLAFGFIPRLVVVLVLVALIALGIVVIGELLMVMWGLVGVISLGFQIGVVLTLIPLTVLYLWLLVRIRVFNSGDRLAVLRLSAELHPVSRPVSWLVEQIGPQEERE